MMETFLFDGLSRLAENGDDKFEKLYVPLKIFDHLDPGQSRMKRKQKGQRKGQKYRNT